MKIIDKSVYNFSKDNAPFCKADAGEVLLFKTMDCFSNKIEREDQLMSEVDFSLDITNPAAGPVYINGAEPGDVLVVDILDIKVAPQGTITCDPHIGPLQHRCVEKTKKIDIVDGYADFNGVKFPIDPMIGVIGTAPAEAAIPDGWPGAHGGNLDCNLHTRGSRIYLPVRTEGALLQMGDVHATMGDAELSGTGIEIPAEIMVKVSLIKDFELNWPVVETENRWYVHSCAKEFTDAIRIASEEMQRLLMDITGWDESDAYMYLSVQGDVEINQACVPCPLDMVLRIGIPKLPQFKPLVGK